MKTYKLLYVDDDEIIRQGVEHNIDWRKNGVELVGVADNGVKGLEMIKTCLPEIVLTDIRMPFMDGIQLTEAVTRLYPQIKIVMLTAYDDFQYAKRALELKVAQYVLKYESNDAVLKAVLAAGKEYDRQRDDAQIIEQCASLLKNKYFVDLATGGFGVEKAESRAKSIGISFFGTQFAAVAAGIQKGGPGSSRLATELEYRKIQELCEKQSRPQDGELYFFTYGGYLNALFNYTGSGDYSPAVLKKALRALADAVRKEFGDELAFGVGSLCGDTGEIPRSYAEAVQVLEVKGLLASDQAESVCFSSEMKRDEITHNSILRQAADFLDNNYSRRELSLDMVAGEVHVSSTYLSTLFKKNMGISLSDYLVGLRLKRASALLLTTDLKTYEIAERVGYSNSQYFSVLFKRSTGYSPTDYRRLPKASAPPEN